MRLSVALLAAAGIAAAVSGAAQAAVPYSTDFEQPAFTPGPVAGQSGWNVFSNSGQPNAAQITTAAAKSGTQSLGVDATVTAQTGPWYDFGAVTSGSLVMSGDIMTPSSAAGVEWQFATLGPGLAGFAGGIDWSGTTIFAITSGFPVIGTFSSDVWHHVDIISNLTSQTFRVVVDGVGLGSYAFCGDNGPCAGSPISTLQTATFDTFGGASPTAPSVSYLDNFSVAAGAPEPAAWLLMLGGFGLAGAALRRRAAVTAA